MKAPRVAVHSGEHKSQSKSQSTRLGKRTAMLLRALSLVLLLARIQSPSPFGIDLCLQFLFLFLLSDSEGAFARRTPPDVALQEFEGSQIPVVYGYEIIKRYDHDPNAFTQGTSPYV